MSGSGVIPGGGFNAGVKVGVGDKDKWVAIVPRIGFNGLVEVFRAECRALIPVMA